MTDIRIVPIDRLDLDFAPRPWSFALERRAEIDAHFAGLQHKNAAIWNGQVLLMHSHAIEGTRLRGGYLQTDYASFMAWRDWGFPDAGMRNAFALGALQGSDGAFLLGVMAENTSNAGRIYFPGGTPEPADVAAGKVDLAASAARELQEETGITPADVETAPGWHAVLAGPRIAMMKTMRARAPAVEVRARILDHIGREQSPELADIRIVRSAADFEPAIPEYMIAFLQHAWQ
jgi:8-oxo-dGTP pyrophosphatase MutT (NUDIX family)